MDIDQMYKIMRAVEKSLDDADLPHTMVNTVIHLNQLGHLQIIYCECDENWDTHDNGDCVNCELPRKEA